MGVVDVKLALARLAGIHRASGAKAQAADLDKVAGLLDENRHASVEDAAAEIARAVNPIETEIRAVTEALTAAGTDRTLFDTLLQRLRTSKSLDKAALQRIANAYAGVERTWKTKKAALDEIEATFVGRAYQANKMKIVEKYKGW